jgi:hypothetical protein
MTDELRIYRIKDGSMDDWLRLFREKVVDAHEAAGIRITAAWVNPEDPDEFVWVRSFDPGSPVAEQKAAFTASPGRNAIGGVNHLVASKEVRLLEPAIEAREPDAADRGGPA